MSRQWKAKWVTTRPEDKFHPVIFKDFYIDDEVTKATLFITGVGLFEAYINGERVSDEYLTPYLNDYKSGVQYFEYDVTDMIRSGKDSEANSIDVFLGNGWYKGRFGLSEDGNIYGDRFALKAELVVEVLKEKAVEDEEKESSPDDADASEVAEVSAEIASEDEERVNTGDRAEALAMSSDEKTDKDYVIEILDIDDLEDIEPDVKESEKKDNVRLQDHEMEALFDDFDLGDEEPEAAEVEEVKEEKEAAEPAKLEYIPVHKGRREKVLEAADTKLGDDELTSLFDEMGLDLNDDTAAEEEDEIAQAVEEIAGQMEAENAKEAEAEIEEATEEEVAEEEISEEEIPEETEAEEEVAEEEAEEVTEEEETEEPAEEESAEEEAVVEEETEEVTEEEEPEDEVAEDITEDEAPEEEEVEEEVSEEEETEEEPEDEDIFGGDEELDAALLDAINAEDDLEADEAADAGADIAAAALGTGAAGAVAAAALAADEDETEPEKEVVKVPETIIIATDETWSYYASDVEESGIYDGEVFNRTLWEDKENEEKQVVLLEEDIPVVERYSLPVVVKETLKVKEIIDTPAGEKVLDFGQNFAGYVEFNSRLEKGETLKMEFGEVLQDGNFYNDNYKSAKGGFTYVSAGEEEVVAPHFTYFGGRYVKITGWKDDMSADDFTGCVIYSDMPRSGYIETSNEKLNRLYENALWSQKSNFIDIPTDCPQRDERLGWTGDINVFTPTACYNMYTKDFLMKFLRDLREQQVRDNGAVAAFIPVQGDPLVSSVWGDAATFIPWTLYQMYGNEEILSDNYDLMKDWVDYIDAEDAKRGERHDLYDFGFHFGDWLAMDGPSPSAFKGATDDYFIASAYYYESTRIVANAAKILGLDEDAFKYSKRARRIKTAFLEEYFTSTGRLAIDTQAAYVVAIRFGLYLDKERIVNDFKARLKKDGFKIKCGFVGATYLCQALSLAGLDDLAWRFLLSEDSPGWLHEVDMGATTIWERWNTVMDDGSMNPSGMNSCNHYSYGSVVEFLYAFAAGIRPKEPGFTEFVIEPRPDGHLREFKCRYRTEHGDIRSEWKINDDGTIKFNFEVPEGTLADLKLPYYPACAADSGAVQLSAGEYEYEYQPSVDMLKKFKEEPMILDIAKDEEAMKIVAETNEALAKALEGADEETKVKTLMEYSFEPFSPTGPEEASKITEKLNELRLA